MARWILVWSSALLVAVHAGPALAALVGYQVSGEFPACNGTPLPPPCGAYSGKFTIDTDAVGVSNPGPGTDYPLLSGTVSLNEPTTVLSGGSVSIENDVFGSDTLAFIVGGGGFKIFLHSPISTIDDEFLTEANLTALVHDFSSWQAYLKYDAPGGGGPAFADALTFSISGTSVPEPTSLALFGIGLAGLGFSRRKQ